MQYKPGQRQQGLDFNWDKDDEKQMHTGYNFGILNSVNVLQMCCNCALYVL